MTSYLLLPSPLLGPAVWAPVARELLARGHQATVAAHPARASTPEEFLDSFVDHAVTAGAEVLVPHSNAGIYAPAVADAARAAATVYVDAALAVESGPTPLAPPGLLAFLETLADDRGVLPPWSRWWPSAELDQLFVDPQDRPGVEAEERQLPVAYFASTLAAPEAWAERPCAYLAFGSTYAEELGRAEATGWPTRVLAGGHLHQLGAASEVCDALEALVRALIR
jgi:hypothetical protein